MSWQTYSTKELYTNKSSGMQHNVMINHYTDLGPGDLSGSMFLNGPLECARTNNNKHTHQHSLFRLVLAA